jgi:hypothetical protein
MKKLILIPIVALIAGIVYSSTFDRVKTGTFKANEARVLNNSISEIETAVTAAEVAWVWVDTNVTTVTTNYVATRVGQMLSGGNGASTNALWVAEALTATNWVKVSEYIVP